MMGGGSGWVGLLVMLLLLVAVAALVVFVVRSSVLAPTTLTPLE